MNSPLASWIERNFEGQKCLQQSTPSGNYYWHRKRYELRHLIRNNQALIKSRLGRDSTFIELGSDTGIDLFIFCDLFKELGINFTRVIGIEADPVTSEIFRLRKEWAKTNVEIVAANLTEPLPLPEQSVDLLYCSEVLEHMADPGKFCEHMGQVLKPGGLLLLTTPNEPNIFQKNYWLPGTKKRMAELRERFLKEGKLVTQDGKSFYLYSHVSLQTCRTCDELLESKGFRLVGYRRGAIRYGGSEWHDAPLVAALYFLAEGLLDLLPLSWTRTFSDQIIALYEKAG